MSNEIAAALRGTLVSPEESDRNMGPANVVDGLFAIARAISDLAGEVEALRLEIKCKE